MFSSEPIILSSENKAEDQYTNNSSNNNNKKKIFLVGFIVLFVIVLAIVAYLLLKKSKPLPENIVKTNPVVVIPSSTQEVLPDFNNLLVASSTGTSTNFSELVIEYLSFADFYKKPDSSFSPKFTDYTLPLNVKLDVTNYYSVSRKLNLDSGIDNLNNNGFTLIDNPFEKETPGFYGAYESLESKQISPLITSDFIIYYYQNIFKKVFKDIEENVFYDNLWSINKDLYTAAKNRYETRLAAIGDINDSILEGERLEMAFFAVSLELLRPAPEQVAPKGAIDDKSKFLSTEVDNFYFVLPPYLREDVLQQEKLIREARNTVKSPVLLYSQNYSDFIVPSEYSTNAKLNNFYLTTKWLNSVFPLNYRDKNCPNCLLDKEDWRINFIAANLISNDAANLKDLKNKWARIYKVISFFKGLREDLNYINYRDSLVSVFGENYEIDQLFDDKNKSAVDNLEKLKIKLLEYKMSEAQGAYSPNDINQKTKIGFKMLAESYWPNNYLFSKLTAPNVKEYLVPGLFKGNNTACIMDKLNQRCNGVALDIINLVTPVAESDYFAENINYLNYNLAADKLRSDLNKNIVWQSTDYWSTLSLIKSFLEVDKNSQPLFAKSKAWGNKSLNTSVAAWINFQLPAEKFSTNQSFKGVGLNTFSGWSDNAYVEPNLSLVNELIANNTMVLKMLSALQVNSEISQALKNLNTANNNLNILKNIITKELLGEKLNQEDKDAIVDFAKQLKIDKTAVSNKKLVLNFPNKNLVLREDLSRLKLMVLIHESEGTKLISVGPVWDYQENR